MQINFEGFPSREVQKAFCIVERRLKSYTYYERLSKFEDFMIGEIRKQGYGVWVGARRFLTRKF